MIRCLPRAVLFSAALATSAPLLSAGELRGRLLLGDRPAAGVTVAAVPYEEPLDAARRGARRQPSPQPLVTVTSGADGSFVLEVPSDAGKERLFVARTEGGGTVAVTIGGVWSSTENGDLGDHALLAAEKIAGKVTDAKGAPVAGAEVVLVPRLDPFADPDLDPAPRIATTAADGTFRFEDAGAGGNTVTVEKPGLLVARRTGVRAGAIQAPFVLSPGASMSGTVRKPDGRSPAPRTLVRVEDPVATRWVEAGQDGAFTIANAPTGSVTIEADAGDDGYLEQRGVRVPIAAGNPLSLVLRPPATLTGRTVDAKTGRPVPRAKVEMRAGAAVRTGRSGPDATYALRGVPPGTWRLRADEPRYVPWVQRALTVRPGEAKKLDIPLVLGAALSGRVTDEGGQPVAGAAGTLTPAHTGMFARIMRRFGELGVRGFRTRPDGTFTATRLAPGANQLLAVSHPDFEPAVLGGVNLVGGATRSGVAIVLQRGSVLAGTVKDAGGHPVAGAEVALSQDMTFRGGRGGTREFVSVAGTAGPDRRADTTAADGRFSVRGVPPGEYALTVKRSGFATERVDPVKVVKGVPQAPIEVTLSPGAFIAGRVVHKSGSGAEGFTVLASRPSGLGLGRRLMADQPTGPDGAFFLDGLKVGQSYDLQLVSATGVGGEKRGVAAPASDVDITVAGTGRISGHARDAQSGYPLTDFQVAFEPDRGGGGGMFQVMVRRAVPGQAGVGQPVGIHSEEGAFTLEDVPAGTWSVVVSAQGYQKAHTGGVVVEEGGAAENVEVRVARGAALKGHVTDAQSGAPVANAIVTFASSGSQPGRAMLLAAATEDGLTTDADGRFEADDLGPGTQTIHVTHPDYTDTTQSVEVGAEGATVEIHMSQGGVLGGTVASGTGQPVPGADVTLEAAGTGGFGGFGAMGAGQSTVADAAGRFAFDHLAAGRYTLVASLRSSTSAPLDVVLQPGQSQENLALQLVVGSTIQGTVSGLPPEMITGMTVTASGADGYFQSTRVGADAGFEFDNVPAGPVTLRGTAADPTGSTRSATKQVTASDDQPVLATQLVFDPGFTLSGRVSQGGQPVSGAMVFASLQGGGGRQASARSDDGGTYSLTGLQEGTYSVNAVSGLTGGGASKRTTIALSSDQTLDIAFPSAKVEGQVADADSKAPLPDATVTIAGQDPSAAGGGAMRTLTTDSNGRFSFANLDAGSYSMTASKPDFRVDQRSVTAADESGDAIVVELSRAAGIGIKVVDGVYGLALSGAMVRVLDAQGSPAFGPTSLALDSNGQGEIPSLPPGTYSVIADASGYAAARLDGVVVPSPTVTVALTPGGTVVIQSGPKTLEAGSASGTLTAATGQPAVLSLFNIQGRVVVSEPTVTLHNVATGSYVLTLPSAGISKPVAVNEGAVTVVPLP